MSKNRNTEDPDRPAVQPRDEADITGFEREQPPISLSPEELWLREYRKSSLEKERPRMQLALVARAAFRALAVQEVLDGDESIRSVPDALELVIRFCSRPTEWEWSEERRVAGEVELYLSEFRPENSLHGSVCQVVKALLVSVNEVAEGRSLTTAGRTIKILAAKYMEKFPTGSAEGERFVQELQRDFAGLASLSTDATGLDPTEAGPLGSMWSPPAPAVRPLTKVLKIGSQGDVPEIEATPTTSAVAGDVPLLDDKQLPAPPDDGRRSRVTRRIDFAAFQERLPILVAELGHFQSPVVVRFQRFLDQLAGEACAKADENSALAKRTNELADAFGLQLFFKAEGDSDRRVRLKFASGIFEAWTPGRGGEMLYSGALFPELRVGGPDPDTFAPTDT